MARFHVAATQALPLRKTPPALMAKKHFVSIDHHGR